MEKIGSTLYRSRPLIVAMSIPLLISCASIIVPVRQPVFGPSEFVRASQEGILLEVHPVVGYESYWDLFDADLPAAGIAAVWVRIQNSSNATVDLKKLRWMLRSGGTSTSDIDAHRVIKELESQSHSQMRSLASEKESYRDLVQVMLHAGNLPAAQSREGYVFLKIDRAQASSWNRDSVLTAKGIHLQNRKNIQVEIPLTYAHP